VTERPDDDLVPVSVRLGEVVPPEDPEDWTRPLTWVAAVGMLAGPAVALAWFAVAAPDDAGAVLPGTQAVAAALGAGAAVTGSTQIGAVRAGTATLGAGLFAALVTVIVGLVAAGERQVAVASPTLAHAFAAALAGLAGATLAAGVAAVVAALRSRLVRLLPAVLVGAAVALGVVPLVLGPA